MIEPMHDSILVERLEESGIPGLLQNRTAKGIIIIPDIAKKHSMLAKVLAVGPGCWRDGEFCKTAVKPGDTVLLPGYGGQHPDWENNQQMLVQEGDIGAIVG